MPDERALARTLERDVDLLLAEEFSVNPEFAKWFLSRTKQQFDDTATVYGVSVSKTDFTGESDLVVVFEIADGGSRFALHIEDKIDARFQPEQLARYRLRAEGAQTDYSAYEIILCCPQRYVTENSECAKFDVVVTYEEMSVQLLAQNPADARLQYRASFLKEAASRSATVRDHIEDAETTKFWDEAFEIANREFPELEMKRLKITKGSTWITFHPHDFPRRPWEIYVSLKGSKGRMDLTFSGSRNYLMHALVNDLLEPGMSLHQTGKSAAIHLETDPFSISDGPVIGETRIRPALAACARLIRFYRKNKQSLDEAARKSICEA
jgi:hypothetical protein